MQIECLSQDDAKIEGLWLGYSKSPTLFSRHCPFGLLFVPADGTLPSWKEFLQFEGYLKSPGQVLCIQARGVLKNRHRKVTWTMQMVLENNGHYVID